MIRRVGLGKQILQSVSVVLVTVTLGIIASCWAFYTLLFKWDPALCAMQSPSWLPEWRDWAFMGLLVFASLTTAVFFAARLTARILTPLSTVTDSVRQIARGDLHARAVAGERASDETAALVDDFNALAQRLERTNHELVTWNAAIAHELRTPVTILRGRLQGLADGVFTPDEGQFRSLLGQIEALSRLIDDLRTLSLADGGQLHLRLDKVDVAHALTELVDLMAPALIAAGFTIDCNVRARYAVCDLSRIRQVVMALLENARRYAHPGPLIVSTVQEQEMFYIRVEDPGPGLSDELAERVFDAFQRGADSRSRHSGGSGLGLAVVRAVAEAHGGGAHYRRSASGAALFGITFPVGTA